MYIIKNTFFVFNYTILLKIQKKNLVFYIYTFCLNSVKNISNVFKSRSDILIYFYVRHWTPSGASVLARMSKSEQLKNYTYTTWRCFHSNITNCNFVIVEKNDRIKWQQIPIILFWKITLFLKVDMSFNTNLQLSLRRIKYRCISMLPFQVFWFKRP